MRPPLLNTFALVLVAASTLALWPDALGRWVLPKILVLALAAMLAVWAVPRGSLPRWSLITGAVAGAVLVVSSLLASDPVSAVIGSWPRFEGVIALTGYGVAAWLGARLLGPASTTREWGSATIAFSLAAAVLGAFTVLESVGVQLIPSDVDRAGALLGNATEQGAVGAALALFLVLSSLRSTTATALRTVALSGVVAGAATVILSGSRAALLALIVGGLVLAVAEFVRSKNRVRAVIAASLILGTVTAIAFIAPTIGPRLLGQSPLSISTITDRVLIWRDTLKVAAQHPFFGVGSDGYTDAVSAVHATDWFAEVGQQTVLDSPHNIVLQSLVVGGPALALILVTGISLAVVNFVRNARVAESVRRDQLWSAAAGSIAVFVVLLTHPTSAATVQLALFLAGAAIAVAPVPVRRAARAVGTGALGAWAALVLVALAAEVALGTAVERVYRGELTLADSAFSTAQSLRPWDPQVVVIAADVLTARLDGGDPRAVSFALSWSTAAADRAPLNLPAAKAAVTTALAAGELDQAQQLLTHYLEVFPLDPWVAHRSGAVLLLQGDLVAAEKSLLRATMLDPSSAAPWQTLEFLYEGVGDASAAREAGRRADQLLR